MSTEGTERDDAAESEGTGPEGTIPASGDGVAAGSTDEPSSFEPEEDAGEGR